MNNEKSISALNMLIGVNNDRIVVYEIASKETYESDLISLFFEFQERSQKCNTELTNEVKKLGGIPIKYPKRKSILYNFWIDFKTSMVNKQREDLLSTCEYDDYKVFKTYGTILEDNFNSLNTDLRSKIKAQELLIKADHDRVKELSDLLFKTQIA